MPTKLKRKIRAGWAIVALLNCAMGFFWILGDIVANALFHIGIAGWAIYKHQIFHQQICHEEKQK